MATWTLTAQPTKRPGGPPLRASTYGVQGAAGTMYQNQYLNLTATELANLQNAGVMLTSGQAAGATPADAVHGSGTPNGGWEHHDG